MRVMRLNNPCFEPWQPRIDKKPQPMRFLTRHWTHSSRGIQLSFIWVFAYLGGGNAGGAETIPPHTIEAQVMPAILPAILREVVVARVIMEIEVETDGRVKAARILESAPAGALDQPMLDSVRQWRFVPKCTPVFQEPFTTTITLSFGNVDESAEDDAHARRDLPESMSNLGFVSTEHGARIGFVDPCNDGRK